MMPNVNMINFGPGQSNADLQAQQLQLQRQQQLADMLRQQAMTPDGTQVVSGRAVKNSPLLGLSQLAKAFMASQMQGQNDKKQGELGSMAAERAQQQLQSMAPPGTFDAQPVQPGPGAPPPQMVPDAPPQPGGGMPTGPLPGMGDPNMMPNGAPPQMPPQAPPQVQQAPQMQAPPPAQATPQVSPEMRQKWAAALQAYRVNPELGAKLVENLMTDTTEQKNMRAMGQDPQAMGRAALAAAIKGGNTEVQGGNTVYGPDMKPLVTAPNFKEGTAGGFGPNGQPSMAPIQGSEAIPALAGQVKRAEAAGTAGYNMVTVQTPQGPVMMTAEQAAQQAASPGGGAPPPAQPAAPPNLGFPSGANVPPPTPGMQSRRDILQAEFDKESASPPTPQRAANLASLTRELRGAGGQMPGIPLQTPADAARQVGQVNNDLAIEKSRIENAQSPEQQQKLIDAGSVVDLTGQARNIIQAGNATGSTAGSLRDKLTSAVGLSTNSSKASAQLAAIGGALVAKQPKMSGPQSDKDVLLYQQMAGRIGDSSVPLGDRLAALDVVERINKKYVQQNQGSVAAQALRANMGAPAAPAPDLSGFKVIR